MVKFKMKNVLIYNQPVLDYTLQYLEYSTILTLQNVINLGGSFYKKEIEKTKLIIFLKRDAINSYTVENLNNLKELNISYYGLTGLPDTIDNLVNLTKLDISCNQLTSLPNSIGNLIKLKELNVCINKLTSLPDTIGNLINLIKLDASFNKLTSLPDTLCNLTKLTYLYIHYNELTNTNFLDNLPNLTNLNISCNKFKTFKPLYIDKLVEYRNYYQN